MELAAEILAYDTRLILELAQRLPCLMSPELRRLYRDLELPLMGVLDDMRHIGIGFDGLRCTELVRETERSLPCMAQQVTGGQPVDLRSRAEVHDLLKAPVPNLIGR